VVWIHPQLDSNEDRSTKKLNKENIPKMKGIYENNHLLRKGRSKERESQADKIVDKTIFLIWA